MIKCDKGIQRKGQEAEKEECPKKDIISQMKSKSMYMLCSMCNTNAYP